MHEYTVSEGKNIQLIYRKIEEENSVVPLQNFTRTLTKVIFLLLKNRRFFICDVCYTYLYAQTFP